MAFDISQEELQTEDQRDSRMIGDCLLGLVFCVSAALDAPGRTVNRLSGASLQVPTPTHSCLRLDACTDDQLRLLTCPHLHLYRHASLLSMDPVGLQGGALHARLSASHSPELDATWPYASYSWCHACIRVSGTLLPNPSWIASCRCRSRMMKSSLAANIHSCKACPLRQPAVLCMCHLLCCQ